jgi:hypothetical protein
MSQIFVKDADINTLKNTEMNCFLNCPATLEGEPGKIVVGGQQPRQKVIEIPISTNSGLLTLVMEHCYVLTNYTENLLVK